MHIYYAFTGHRPNKLGGYTPESKRRLIEFAKKQIGMIVTSDDHIISGMAQGWDQAVAWAGILLNIPVIAAVPCENQDERWGWRDKLEYRNLLGRIQETGSYSLISREYTADCMQMRNEWMVDRCDVLVALHNGSSGGTLNCIKYAKKQGRPILNLWPMWADYQKAI